jgi:hypothetical protein
MAVAAPFRTAAPGVLFEPSHVNAVLDAAAGLRTQPLGSSPTPERRTL